MAINIISLVEKSQTDDVTERDEESVGSECEATQGALKTKQPNPAKKKGLRDEHHIYKSLPRNADKYTT